MKDVQEAIAALKEKSAVAAILNEQLLSLPCSDASRHLLLLSTIGELRQPSSVAALERFAWLRDEQIFDTISPPQADCTFEDAGMLQARAAEMMVWVLQGKNDESVLRVIRDHPSRAVRMAAIDGYLFQRGDTPAAIEFLRSQVSAGDRSMVGLPRFGAHADPETFERLSAEYEAANPPDIRQPKKQKPLVSPGSPVWLGVCAAGVIGLGLLIALKSARTAKRGEHDVH